MQQKELGVEMKRREGSRKTAEYLTDLNFADDIALVSHTLANAQVLLQHLEAAAATVGLFINRAKTKALVIGDKAVQALSLSPMAQSRQFQTFATLDRGSERLTKISLPARHKRGPQQRNCGEYGRPPS